MKKYVLIGVAEAGALDKSEQEALKKKADTLEAEIIVLPTPLAVAIEQVDKYRELLNKAENKVRKEALAYLEEILNSEKIYNNRGD